MDTSTTLPLLLGLLLALAGGVSFVLAGRRADRQATEGQIALARELEAQRALDREATAALLRSVVAEHGGTVEATVQTMLSIASDKLGDHAAAGTHALDLRQQAIDQQVGAVTGELREMRALVESLRTQGASHHGELSQALSEAVSGTQRLHQTTDELRRALASPKTRGQWGERMADDVLRASGLREGLNYRKQKALAGGTVPDVTFFMPRNLLLNMDVKFPVDNYLKYLAADTDADAERFRSAFLRDVRARVKEITTRDYIDPDHTVDCVLLFIPNEAVYSFIHEQDPSIADLALEHKVILCSPFTLLGVLGVVRQAMDNFLLERTSDEILQCLTGLTHEWTRFTTQLDKVGRAVDSVQKSYDALAGTRRRAFEKRLDHIDAIRQRRGAVDDADAPGDPGWELDDSPFDEPVVDGASVEAPSAPLATLPELPELPELPVPARRARAGLHVLRRAEAG